MVDPHVLHDGYSKGHGMCYAANRVSHVVVAADFLSRYLNGPLPYV